MFKKPTYEELEKRVRELEQVELERKRTEEELAQIFSMSLDMICAADINTATFIKVNPAFTEILGYSEEELLDKTFFDFIHPDDIDATFTVLDQKLKKNVKVINFENRYRCKNGNFRWLSWVSHPNTEKGATFAVARDITEWKQNQKALKKSKEFLEATNRMARVGGWELDVDTMEVTWTTETYHIHEVPLDQNPSLQEAISFFHPEDRPQLEQAIERSINYGGPYDIKIRLITAKGNNLWTHTKCYPKVVGGKTLKLKGTFQDITNQKMTEDALKESEKKYRENFHEAQVALFRTSITDGTLIDVNERYVQLAGYSTIEQCKASFHPGKAWVDSKSRENLKNLLAEEGSVSDYEAEILRGDGIHIWIALSATIYPEKGYIEGSIEDITKRKDAYDQLNDINTALDVLLKKREKENQEIEENILSNYELMIKPFLTKIKNRVSNKNQQNLISILDTNLKEIVSPFAKKLSDPMMKLTSTELQITAMIKQGFSNKEISQMLYCSKRTIDSHRENIREKLKLKNKKINLKTFLTNL